MVTGLGALLRFYAFGRVQPNPYYDAAVRSMAQSWHNLFFGAAEPAAGVSVDKAPLDLWLQVASTKLLGFGSTSLRLPETLAGTAAIPLLYDLVRRLSGSLAGLVSALGLAVMPIAVLTARSDTMDSLMMLFMLLAAWCLLRAVSGESHDARWACLAGVSLGLAFEIKLFESLIVVPALVGFYLLASPLAVGRRLRTLALGGVVLVVVALSWATVVSLTPAQQRPYPLGSSDGSVWNAIFVFNGVGRLGQTPGVNGVGANPKIVRQGDRGVRRLFSDRPVDYRSKIGGELFAALVLGAFAAACHPGTVFLRPRTPEARLRRAGAALLGVWLLTGALLFSFVNVLPLRYLEAFTPAVAGTLGVSLVALSRPSGRRWLMPVALALLAATCLNFLLRGHPGAFIPSALTGGMVGASLLAFAALAALSVRTEAWRRASRWAAPMAVGLASATVLLPPLEAARALTLAGAQDSGTPGRRPAAQTARLSRFLRAGRQGARYEVATLGVGGVSALIVRDGLPVLFLSNLGRQPLLPLERFVRLVHTGQVRFVLVGACPPRSRSSACDATGRWTRRHGRDVSAQVRLAPASLYQVGPPPIRAGGGSSIPSVGR